MHWMLSLPGCQCTKCLQGEQTLHQRPRMLLSANHLDLDYMSSITWSPSMPIYCITSMLYISLVIVTCMTLCLVNISICHPHRKASEDTDKQTTASRLSCALFTTPTTRHLGTLMNRQQPYCCSAPSLSRALFTTPTTRCLGTLINTQQPHDCPGHYSLPLTHGVPGR